MPVPFIMPKFDMDQEKAVIISWCKKEGDFVKFEESVLTVETEKVAIDVPAPATGTLAGILFKDGDEVPVTKVIAYILKEGETLRDLPNASLPTPPSKPQVTLVSQLVPAPHVTVPATPAARRVARESGIPLETVAGSGPRGRVQSVDVLSAAKPVLTVSPTAQVNAREAEIVPLTSIRRTIAERMQQSFQESPHIALTVEVDMTEAESARKRFNSQAEKLGQPRITITALIIKVVAWALVRNPYINASFNGDSISLWKDVNIGVATAVSQGLVVPVLKGADHLGVSEINMQLIALAERARANKLKLDDVQGGTFTISNLGMFGIRQFRAVINPPESAILAVGSVVRAPIVVDDQDRVEVRPMMSLTISADHRVIDGIVAARFLSDLVIGLESPSMLLY